MQPEHEEEEHHAPQAVAAAAAPNNPWKRGPPPGSVAAAAQGDAAASPRQQHHQNANAPHPRFSRPQPTPHGPRVGRVHHNLDAQDAQIHAYQLSVAQQMCMAAMSQGRDLSSFQLDVARSSGLDERALAFQLEPFTLRLTGTEPPLGLTLIRDDEAYTHIELLQRYPHLASVNFLPVDLKLTRGAMFLAICAKEAQVHEALKYGYWMLPNGAQLEIARLNELFAELCGIAPIYLFVACLESCAFSGVCEMVAPAAPAEPGPSGKYANMHRVPIRFVMCKNVPFSHLPFINLFQQQQQGVLLQPMQGADHPSRALHQYARYPTGTSVLMDFKHFDEAEARGVEGESGEAALRAAQKAKQFHHHHQHQQPGRRTAPAAPFNPNHPRGPPRVGASAAAAAATTRAPRGKEQQRDSAQHQPPQQRESQLKGLISASEERVSLPNKIVFEVTQKKSNKERKLEAKQLQLQRRQEEEEEQEQEGEEAAEAAVE